MLVQLLKHYLKDFSSNDVNMFISQIWESLVGQQEEMGKRFVGFDNDNIVFRQMICKIPFLQIIEPERIVKFKEYETHIVPGTSFRLGLKLLHSIEIGNFHKGLFGKIVSDSEKKESRESMEDQVLRDLKIFSLITDENITQYTEKYLETKDINYLAKGILTNPCMNFYYTLFISLQDIEDRKIVRGLIKELGELILFSSRGLNRITKKVTIKRTSSIISWFRGTGLIDRNLRPIFEQHLLYKKKVNYSLFKHGLAIPQDHQDVFFKENGEVLAKGEKRQGKLIISGQEYDITFTNPKRKSKSITIHIRYDGNQNLRNEILKRFHSSYDYIMDKKDGKRRQVEVPDNLAEYLLIYSTGQPYHYRVEFITADENAKYHKTVKSIGDQKLQENCTVHLPSGKNLPKEVVKKMRQPKPWIDEIREAFEDLGGIAHLDLVCQKIHERGQMDFEVNKTWPATVRRTIQEYSSDSTLHRHEEDYFYSVEGLGNGVWGLRYLIEPSPNPSYSVETPERVRVEVSRFNRDSKMSRELKQRYNNSCQICGTRIQIGPDQYYSEAHHIKPLGNGHHGVDTRENLLVLCPNHHTEFDHGVIAIDPETRRILHINRENQFDGTLFNSAHQIGNEFLAYHLNNIFKKR